jgi:hypothetical protein
MTKLDPPLTFREAAKELGWAHDPEGRQLRELVLAREKELGRRIAIRSSAPVRPKMKVTIGALTRALPQLKKARVDRLAAELRPILARTEGLIRDEVREQVRKQQRGKKVAAKVEYDTSDDST